MWTSEHQNAERSGLGRRQTEGVGQFLPVFDHPARGAFKDKNQFLVSQPLQCPEHSRFAIFNDRLAIGRLIAGVDQGIQRERVVVRRGDCLLHQRTEDADFRWVEDDLFVGDVHDWVPVAMACGLRYTNPWKIAMRPWLSSVTFTV